MKKKIIVCAVISSVVVVALIATILVLQFSDMNGETPADDTTSDSANVIAPPGRISIPGFGAKACFSGKRHRNRAP